MNYNLKEQRPTTPEVLLPQHIDTNQFRTDQGFNHKQEREQKKKEVRMLRREYLFKEFKDQIQDHDSWEYLEVMKLHDMADKKMDKISMREWQRMIRDLKARFEPKAEQENQLTQDNFEKDDSLDRDQQFQHLLERSIDKTHRNSLSMKIRKSYIQTPGQKSDAISRAKFWKQPNIALKNMDPKGKNQEGGISYKKLKKMIQRNHPNDPEKGGEKFDVFQSITVKNFGIKLIGLSCCFDLAKWWKNFKVKDLVFKKEQLKREKPGSMADVASTDSSDSDVGDSFKGLSSASRHLGEGATLYLQTMQTLAILFFVLALINIPVFIIYSGSTRNNNYKKMDEIFKYFTLGNLAQTNSICGFSSIDHADAALIYQSESSNPSDNSNESDESDDSDESDESNESDESDKGGKVFTGPKDPSGSRRLQSQTTLKDPNLDILGQLKSSQISMECQQGYIEKIEHFGFLYLLDHENGWFSEPLDFCKKIDPEIHEKNDFKAPSKTSIAEKTYTDISLKKEHQPAITEHNIDKDCNSVTMFKPDAKNKFDEYFKTNCQLEPKCVIDTKNIFDGLKLAEIIKPSCLERIYNEQITSHHLLSVFGCRRDMIPNPFNSEQKIHKQTAGLWIAGLDILSIIITYVVFRRLKDLNQEYIETMDKNIVQMSRFTVQINGMKLDKGTQDLRILKMKIWLYIKKILSPKNKEADAKKLEKKMSDSDSDTEEIDTTDYSLAEIADIQFSYSTSLRYQTLLRLGMFQEQIEDLERELKKQNLSTSDKAEIQEDLKKVQNRKAKYELKYREILTQDEQINFATVKVNKAQYLPSIDYVWVTFKDNTTPKKVLKDCEIVHPFALICNKWCFDKPPQVHEFDDQELEITKAVEPDQILWNNLKDSMAEGGGRQALVNIALGVTTITTLLLTIFLNGQQAKLSLGIDCSQIQTDDSSAWRSQQQLEIQQLSQTPEGEDPPYLLSDRMICYCKEITQTGTEPLKAKSEQWKNLNTQEEEAKNYCGEYVRLVYKEKSLINANRYSTVIFNTIISEIFQVLGQYVIVHTTIQQTIGSFKNIVLVEYFNMALIFLIEGFDPTGTAAKILGKDTEEQKMAYEGFESDWYMKIGLELCFTVFASTIVTNINEFKRIAQVFFNRFKDRGYKKTIKKIKKGVVDSDSDDAEVNTQLQTQNDLEQLYLGDKFEGEKSYSRMMSTLLVTLSFSAGMPILYAVAAGFYILTFFVNKLLLFQFYQKTNTLNRDVPNFSMSLLNLSIVFHMIVGCFMLTNSSIFEAKRVTGRSVDFQGNIQLKEDSWLQKRVQYPHQIIYIIFVALWLITLYGGKKLEDCAKVVYKGLKLFWRYLKEKVFNPIGHWFRRNFDDYIKWLDQSIYAKMEQEKNDRNQAIEDERKQVIEQILNGGSTYHGGPSSLDKNVTKIFPMSDAQVNESENQKLMDQNGKPNDSISNDQPVQQDQTKKDETKAEDPQPQKTQNDEAKAEDPQPQKNCSSNQFYLMVKTKCWMRFLKRIYMCCWVKSNRKARKFQKLLRQSRKFSIEEIRQMNIKWNNGLKVPTNDEITMKIKALRKKQDYKNKVQYPYMSSNIFMELNMENLVKMYQKCIKEYKDANKCFNITDEKSRVIVENKSGDPEGEKKDLRIIFKEICFVSKVEGEEVFDYLDNFLFKRIKTIEKVIDHHFMLITDEIKIDRTKMLTEKFNKLKDADPDLYGEDKAMTLRAYIDGATKDDVDLMLYPIEKKLDLLLDYETDLIKSAKEPNLMGTINRKLQDNREGIQNFCRMTGSISQSYFILDQKDYLVARQIYYDFSLQDEVKGQDIETPGGALVEQPAVENNDDKTTTNLEKKSTNQMEENQEQPCQEQDVFQEDQNDREDNEA